MGSAVQTCLTAPQARRTEAGVLPPQQAAPSRLLSCTLPDMPVSAAWSRKEAAERKGTSWAC